MKDEQLPVWKFTYHKGLQSLDAQVYARDETEAMAVATAWCRKMGSKYRPPASVQKAIVAGPSILEEMKALEPAGVAN